MKRFAALMISALVAVSLSGEAAFAAKKKKTLSRDQFTAAEREKLHQQGMQLCRKKFGPALSRVVIDYKKRRYVCYLHH